MRILVILAVAFAIAWLVLVVLLHTVFHLYSVPTGAMEPTIHVGDHVITKRAHEIARGDIVVFKYPLHQETMFAKRAVGIPGDTIEIKAKHLFLNGREVNEPFAAHFDEQVYPKNEALPEPYRSRDYFGPLTIPADKYCDPGDNRDQSSDSRYWGCVPRSLITGIAMYDFGRDGFRKLHQ